MHPVGPVAPYEGTTIMSIYCRGRVELEVATDATFTDRLVPLLTEVFSETSDDCSSIFLDVATATDTPLVSEGWTKGSTVLLVNDQNVGATTTFTIKGDAADTGISLEAGGILLLTKADITSLKWFVRQTSGVAKKLRVVVFGT